MPDPEQTILEWKVYLAARQPARAAVACLLMLAAGAIAYLAWGHLGYAALTVGLLMGSLADFFFPVRFRLTDQAAYSRGVISLRRLPWDRVRACCHDAQGIKLSPLPRPSRLEAYRGVYLWLNANGQEVRRAIKEMTASGVRVCGHEGVSRKLPAGDVE